MLASLRHRAVGSRNHQDRAVHLRRTRDHVLDVVGVPRAVDVCVVTRFGLVLNVRGRDRDATLALLGRLVDVREIDLVAQTFRRDLRDRSRQRRLAVVNVTNRANVDVRLGPLELLLPLRLLVLCRDSGDLTWVSAVHSPRTRAHDSLRHSFGTSLVLRELHRVARPTLRHGARESYVSEHLGQRHLARSPWRYRARSDALIWPRRTTGRRSRHPCSHRGDDLDVHDRLKQLSRPCGGLFESHRASDLERHLDESTSW